MLSIDPLSDLTRLRRPDPTVAPWEQALAEAGRTWDLAAAARLDTQMEVDHLDDLLAPTAASAARIPIPDPVAGIGELLDRIGSSALGQAPPEIAAGPGVLAPNSSGWRHPSVIATELDGSVVIRIDLPAGVLPGVDALVDDIATCSRGRVDVALLLAGARAPRTDRRPEGTLLIVGLDGTVEAHVAGEGTQGPVAIGRGDVLAVPAGRAVGLAAQGAAWLELTVHRMTQRHHDAHLVRRATGLRAFRESIPLDLDRIEPRPDSIFGRPDGVAAALAALDRAAIAAEAEAGWCAALRSRAVLSASDILRVRADGARPIVGSPGGWAVVEVLPVDDAPMAAGEAAVAVAGRLVRGAPDLLASLADGSWDRSLLGPLARAGLLTPPPREAS